VAWESATIEQEAFSADMITRDQQMSIGRMFFERTHDSFTTAVST
jgi:hypothetical protein